VLGEKIMSVTFEKATSIHKQIIFSWLAEPHVQEFWDNTQDHKDDLLNFMNGRKKLSSYADGKYIYWVAKDNGHPFAMLMTIRALSADDLDGIKLENLSKTGNSYGIEYMIGDRNYLGKGYGAKTLSEFVDFFRTKIDTEADTFLIDPTIDNSRAKHVYMKAGFEHVGDFVMSGNVSGTGKQHHLLVKHFQPRSQSSSTIIGMNHITLAVKDIDKAFEFYSKVVDLKPLVKWDKGAYFLINNFWFCLNVDKNRRTNPCYTHYAFTVAEENFRRISQNIIDSGTQIFKENSSSGNSLYFLDPDDHKLEIHVGTWQERIAEKKSKPGDWKNIKWFV